jgi:hypothetical protein
LRGGCRKLRTCWIIQPIHPRHVCSRNQMAIGVYGDLDGAVAHLILHVNERCAVLDEQTSERVTKIVEAKATEPRLLDAGQKIIVNQVGSIQHCPSLREKNQIVGYSRFSLKESFNSLLKNTDPLQL